MGDPEFGGWYDFPLNKNLDWAGMKLWLIPALKSGILPILPTNLLALN
jgi:hypothetical protein